jgi:hypothetical protein
MCSIQVGLVALVISAALLTGACSDDAGTSAPTSATSVSTAAAPATAARTTAATTTQPTTAAATTDSAAVGRFEKVVPGGDCQCADGSEFSFWVKEADPAKVVFYFAGGGACFSKETCKFRGGTYDVRASGDDPNYRASGIWDQADGRNPFQGWSAVYVPSCTGDVHLGNAEHDYGGGLVVQHRGYVNGLAALDELVARFPDAEQVVVTGESGGGVPAPLFAGLVGDELPAADIVAIADSSGAYPEVSPANAGIGALWGRTNAIPDWPETAGSSPEQWSIPGLFAQAGLHNPRIRFGRHDYAYDRTQTQFSALAGIGGDDLLVMIDQNEQVIEGRGVPIAGYVAPGQQHTVFSQDRFFTEEVNGVKLVDWVQALVGGATPPDVHCTECRTG